MSVEQLSERIAAIAARYGLTPMRRLDLTSDLLKLFAEYMTDERDRQLERIDRVFGTEKAA